ncbi:hypothetical protein PWJ77_14045 [Bacillus sp. CNPSo 3703]|uniref:hypothetical protein n=1 Tax=Bacillus TaxID=1386 RepID=UPI001933D7CA|nr:hypothetical protein [Bacillus altitudinis]MDE0641581.1 hypothetical protein [Bacillus altitudinis]MEE3605991.1 hypothetical protein [Bacillus altitudinis]MEE3612360.1 hypothetical protein [Bacillus altitudinis]MEE3648537.1 hypothetical protein [Bacillus altitudinis]MEE4392153.1 hypothetical protein [Bacillus altitudinis]
MAKIPIKPIINTIKDHAPRAGKFIKENWKEVVTVVERADAVGKRVNDYRKSKKAVKQNQGKMHFRKARYAHYKTKIMGELDNKKRRELFQYKLEVEQFIRQIKNEEDNELGVKKPIHSKRTKKWKEVLIQIIDKMKIKDYQEYLMLYNNPNYECNYFEGYEGEVEKFKRIINSDDYEELHNFIFSKTGKSKSEIEKDFL